MIEYINFEIKNIKRWQILKNNNNKFTVPNKPALHTIDTVSLNSSILCVTVTSGSFLIPYIFKQIKEFFYDTG